MIRLGGEGQPVVLLHGYGADKHSWLGVAPALFKLGTVWVADLPGHGDAWQSPPANTLATMAEQLAPAIFDVHDKPVHLVGHSLGAALLLLCANSAAERVASISLIAPVGLGRGVNTDFLEQYPLLREPDAALGLLRSTVCNQKLISRHIAPLILSQLARKGVREALQMYTHAILNGETELKQATDGLRKSDVPRQVIWGLQDSINPPLATDEALFGGQWHRLAHCGHLPHIEHRTAVNEYLANFIEYNYSP